MKIVEVNAYHVRPRWGFVEIITDEGITGWGEAVLEGHCDAVLACVQEYRSYLIGQDPFRIEDISATIFRAGFYRGGGVLMSALSGIDQALWDIKGKAFGTPAYELMGGKCRDKIKVYSWIGGDRPSDVGTAAKERQDAGFKAIKMNATEELQMIDSYDKIDAVLERVAAIRESCLLKSRCCVKIWKCLKRLPLPVIFQLLRERGSLLNMISRDFCKLVV